MLFRLWPLRLNRAGDLSDNRITINQFRKTRTDSLVL